MLLKKHLLQWLFFTVNLHLQCTLGRGAWLDHTLEQEEIFLVGNFSGRLNAAYKLLFIQSIIILSYFSLIWFSISKLAWGCHDHQRNSTEGREVWKCSNFLFILRSPFPPFAVFFSDSSPLAIRSAALPAFCPVEKKMFCFPHKVFLLKSSYLGDLSLL